MSEFSRRKFLSHAALASGAFCLVPPQLADAFGLVSDDFQPRTVAQVIAPMNTRVGDVFDVRRTIPLRQLAQVDPFLLLDHFDFTLRPGQPGGLAPHPHRGFETVTLLFDGAIEHGDSLGNRGRIESGDVQWMTAGSGIVHEENPDDQLRARGGRVLGIQLWVNLPRRHKMTAPKYQDTANAKIPVTRFAGVSAKVIAGNAHDVNAVIETHTPLILVDYQLQPGAEVALPYPTHWTAFLHVVNGTLTVGTARVGEAHMAHLNRSGGGIHFRNETAKTTRVLLGGGAPIGEPIARRGPFVMNTGKEIRQAVADYRAGRMGRVKNPTYDRIRRR